MTRQYCDGLWKATEHPFRSELVHDYWQLFVIKKWVHRCPFGLYDYRCTVYLLHFKQPTCWTYVPTVSQSINQVKQKRIKTYDYQEKLCAKYFFLLVLKKQMFHNIQLIWFLVISSANIERYSKLFRWWIYKETLYVSLTEISTSPQLHCYTLWNTNVKNKRRTFTPTVRTRYLTILNNIHMTTVTFEPLHYLLNFRVFLHSTYNWHLSLFLHNSSICSPCCWTTHSSRRRH